MYINQIHQGIELKQQKRYDEAIMLLSQCQEADPNNAEVLFHIGDIYLIFKYPNEALQCFDQALIVQPNSPTIIKEIGRALMLKQEFSKAVGCFLKVYKLDQNQTDIFKLITMCYMENQEYDKAFVYANQLLVRFPKDPDSYCLRGKYYLNTSKYEQSIDSLNICLKLRPNNAYALGTKGQALMMLGKMQESHQCLNKAIQINPNIAELHVDSGLLFEGMSNIYLAMMSYDQALQIQSDNQISIQRLYNLKLHQFNQITEKQGQKSKILKIYQEIINLDQAKYFIGYFYTLSNFLAGYLNINDLTKLNYQKQIGYIKNILDINYQMNLSYPPISIFFRCMEAFLQKTSTQISQSLQEWMSQKYLKQNKINDFNLSLAKISLILSQQKTDFTNKFLEDKLIPILQSNENQIYQNQFTICGLFDSANLLQRMLIYGTQFLDKLEGDFVTILCQLGQ